MYIYDKQVKVFEADGTVFEGDISNNKRHGTGTEIYTDGSRYIGGWVDDKKQGKGILFNKDG